MAGGSLRTPPDTFRQKPGEREKPLVADTHPAGLTRWRWIIVFPTHSGVLPQPPEHHANATDPELKGFGLSRFVMHDGDVSAFGRRMKQQMIAIVSARHDRRAHPKIDRKTDAVARLVAVLRRPGAIAVTRRRVVLNTLRAGWLGPAGTRPGCPRWPPLRRRAAPPAARPTTAPTPCF